MGNALTRKDDPDVDWEYCRRAERVLFIPVKGAAASTVG
jgi:hypothetical protein